MKPTAYFTKKGKSVIFTGKKLEIFVPERYEGHGYLDSSDTVKTLGIFDMRIDDEIDTGYMFCGVIEIAPSEITTQTINGQVFKVLTLFENDLFLMSTDYVVQPDLAYVVFYEMYHSGNFPRFLTYDRCLTLFDYVSVTTEASFRVEHTILELIPMMLFRDGKDISKQYRNTPMTSPPQTIGLNNIAHVISSTSTRVSGAYARDGLEAILGEDAPTQEPDLEKILRY